MNPIHLYSELDLVHRGQYIPFTLLGVILFIGIILLFSAVTFKNFSDWIAPTYLSFLIASLIFEIVFLNKIMTKGNIIFREGLDKIKVDITIDEKILHSGEVVDFSYWWGDYTLSIHEIGEGGDFIINAGRGNKNLFLEFVYENGQRIILYETILDRESIPPNWTHKTGHISLEAMNFPTFKIKEMVELLSRELGRK